MRERDKPFVLYRGGLVSLLIVPRGIRGWGQFALWLGLCVPLFVWLGDHVRNHPDGPDYLAGVMLFVFGVIVWLIGGLWWMLARAEVIEMVEVRRSRQYERWERERARRRQQDTARQEAARHD